MPSKYGEVIVVSSDDDEDFEPPLLLPQPKGHRHQNRRRQSQNNHRLALTTSSNNVLMLNGQQLPPLPLPLPPSTSTALKVTVQEKDGPSSTSDLSSSSSTVHQNGHQNHNDTIDLVDTSDESDVDQDQVQVLLDLNHKQNGHVHGHVNGHSNGHSNGHHDDYIDNNDIDDTVSLGDEPQPRKKIKMALPAGQLMTRQSENDTNAFWNKSIELLKLKTNPHVTFIYNPQIILPRFRTSSPEEECELIIKKYERDLLKPPVLRKGQGQIDKKKFLRGTFRKEDIERILKMTFKKDNIFNPQNPKVILARMPNEMDLLRVGELKNKTFFLYKLLVEEEEQRNKESCKVAWNENLKVVQDSIQNHSNKTKLSRIKVKSTSGDFIATNYTLNNKLYKIWINRLPHIRRLPIMTTFCYTTRNFGVDKEILTNLPYFPEYESDDPQIVEKEKEFIDELLHQYNYRYHKERGTKMTNYVLYHLFKKLSEFYDVEFGSYVDVKLKKEHIFTAISTSFPLFGFPVDIKDQYNFRTLKEFDETAPETPYIPSLDGPNAVRLPRKKVLESLGHHFCRRCYQLDCGMHPTDDKIPPEYFSKKIEIDKPDDEEILCRKHYDYEINYDWSPAEETLLEAIWPLCPEKYCALSDLLETRSCHEIIEHCQATNLLNNSLSSLLDGKGQDSSTERQLNLDGPKQKPKVPRGYTSTSADDDDLTSCYVPCQHKGNSCTDDCNCVKAKIKCEKFCSCPPNCGNKWKGCRCKKGNCYGYGNIHKCPCFNAGRECDVDLCHDCGSHESDPEEIRCRNINIQRLTRKRVVIGRSSIKGWGAFAGEDIKKDQFIMEYTGEVLINEECSKRDLVYDKRNHTFLFKLNAHRVVDATRKGNTIRFANSSYTPNLYARSILVYGDMHIAIYAKRNIGLGEELFLDYNDAIKLGKKKVKKGEYDVVDEVKRFRPKALKNLKMARKFAQPPQKPVPLFTLRPDEEATVEDLHLQLVLPPISQNDDDNDDQNGSSSSNSVCSGNSGTSSISSM